MPEDAELAVSGRRLVYLAAERTLMSWVRTALAIMAFGFVVDRFDVFLRRAGVLHLGVASSAARDYVGTPIVLIGAIMSAVGAVRYIRFARRYRRDGSTEPGHGLLVASVFAILVAALGIALTFFLLTVGR